MAFTATILSIAATDDNGSGIKFLVVVCFADSESSWSTNKSYAFPINTSRQSAANKIKADGAVYKTALGTISDLQSDVGTVFTI